MWRPKKERMIVRSLFLGFVNGDIDSKEFWNNYEGNLMMQNALVKLKSYDCIASDSLIVDNLYLTPKNLLDKFDISLFSHRVQLYDMVACYLLTHKINFISGNRDKLEYDFIAEVLPPYVYALIENIDYLHQVLETAPVGFNENELKNWAKNKMLDLFQFEKTPPDWIQDPQWPFVQGEPLYFRFQKEADNGIVEYYFYNRKTNEEVVIEQVE